MKMEYRYFRLIVKWKQIKYNNSRQINKFMLELEQTKQDKIKIIR